MGFEYGRRAGGMPTRADRRLGAGCVRVEDPQRLARWPFGGRADRDFGPEHRIDLPQPMAVSALYLNAGVEVRRSGGAHAS